MAKRRGTGNFATSVEKWVRETEGAAEAVFKQASQEVLAEAQRPVSQGGNMPVDTGFLRASLVVGLNNEPDVAATSRRARTWKAQSAADEESITLTLAPAKLGYKLEARWTAEYAAHVEYGARGRPGRGFARAAATKWQAFVDAAVAKLGAALGR